MEHLCARSSCCSGAGAGARVSGISNNTGHLDEATGLKRNENGELVRGEARRNREHLINRPRKDKKKPGKKVFPFVTGWDPRMPDLRQAVICMPVCIRRKW